MHIDLGVDTMLVSRELAYVDASFSENIELVGAAFGLNTGRKTIIVISSFFPQTSYFRADVYYDDYDLVLLMDTNLIMDTIRLNSDSIIYLFSRKMFPPLFAEACTTLNGFYFPISRNAKELTGQVIFQGKTFELPTVEFNKYTGKIYGQVSGKVDFKAVKLNAKKMSQYLNTTMFPYKLRLRGLLEQQELK
ncbi:MAG TPA: hypothetical protein VF399_11825 [bacterium]